MTSRGRVRKTIHFQSPDRTPHYLPDGGPNDILWLWVPRPPERQPWTSAGPHERRIDEWGVVWEKSERNSGGEAVVWPIPDIARQAEYRFPDLNHPRCFEGVRREIRLNDSSEDPKYALGVMPFNSLNEGTHNIVGLHSMFLAYYERPADLKALIARLAAEQRESIRILADCGCNGVMGYDDWGLQDRLMVGRDLVEEFFMPLYRENWALAHALGMDVWLHSCGCILDLLPAFAEAGLNVIQMDQQENSGIERLDRAVGGRLAFWCPVDIQQTMVHGSTGDIEAYARRMIRTLGGHHGGFISMAYSSPEAVGHSPKNTAAMCAAFRRYGLEGSAETGR